jgi:hypothetical protein
VIQKFVEEFLLERPQPSLPCSRGIEPRSAPRLVCDRSRKKFADAGPSLGALFDEVLKSRH